MPVKFTQKNKIIQMSYDYLGRRVRYIEKAGNVQNLDRRYVYNGFTLVQDLYTDNNVAKEFVWDPTAGEATKPLMMKLTANGGMSLFYTYDANKNVSEMVYRTIENGIGAHYEYSPFGETVVLTRNTSLINTDICTENPFRFSSEYHDDALGLIYYNYRHYNPQSGRWISRDPIEENGGNNLYGICQNNLIKYWDYLGKVRIIGPSKQCVSESEFEFITVNMDKSLSGFYLPNITPMSSSATIKTKCTKEITIVDYALAGKIYIKEAFKNDLSLQTHELKHHRIWVETLSMGESYAKSLAGEHRNSLVPYVQAIISDASQYYIILGDVNNFKFDNDSYSNSNNLSMLNASEEKLKKLKESVIKKVNAYNKALESC